MRPCHSTTATPRKLLPSSESTQPHLKRSKRSPDSSPWPSKSKTDIHDLPDFALVEFLCRIPHKFVLQCKSVCKRWSSLICNENFRSRFLWVQSHSQKLAPLQSTLVFRDAKDKSALFMLPELELPMLKSHFSLPHLGATDYITTSDDGAIVVGTYNDLVLLCGEKYYQSDYYIWNPYTKQSVRLPPTPKCYKEVRVGFICEPYYKEDQKEESITGSGMIHADADYRYAIVRICAEVPSGSASDYFTVEIFSSETRKWTESVIRSSRKFCLNNMSRSGGIACNGMLYWLCSRDGFIVRFDPFGYSNNNKYKTAEGPYFHIVDAPYRESKLFNYDSILSVCRGRRLRICAFFYEMDDAIPSMSVFELKEDGKWWELAGDLVLDTMVYENPVINEWRFSPTEPKTLAFDPSNEDILYLELFDHIVACDIRERKLIDITLPGICRSTTYSGVCVFPFVLPVWPTPLPRLKSN